jgi:hypothetical protein
MSHGSERSKVTEKEKEIGEWMRVARLTGKNVTEKKLA